MARSKGSYRTRRPRDCVIKQQGDLSHLARAKSSASAPVPARPAGRRGHPGDHGVLRPLAKQSRAPGVLGERTPSLGAGDKMPAGTLPGLPAPPSPPRSCGWGLAASGLLDLGGAQVPAAQQRSGARAGTPGWPGSLPAAPEARWQPGLPGEGRVAAGPSSAPGRNELTSAQPGNPAC